jgi:hypothetical protein
MLESDRWIRLYRILAIWRLICPVPLLASMSAFILAAGRMSGVYVGDRAPQR